MRVGLGWANAGCAVAAACATAGNGVEHLDWSQPSDPARPSTHPVVLTTQCNLTRGPSPRQNTYVDMAHFGPYIDAAMAAAKIPKVANPLPVTLKDAVGSTS